MTYLDETGLHAINLFFFFFPSIGVMWHSVNSHGEVYSAFSSSWHWSILTPKLTDYATCQALKEHLPSRLVETTHNLWYGLRSVSGISTAVVNLYVHVFCFFVFLFFCFLLPPWKHRNLIREENADYVPVTQSTFDTCLANPTPSVEMVMLSNDRLEAIKKKSSEMIFILPAATQKRNHVILSWNFSERVCSTQTARPPDSWLWI